MAKASGDGNKTAAQTSTATGSNPYSDEPGLPYPVTVTRQEFDIDGLSLEDGSFSNRTRRHWCLRPAHGVWRVCKGVGRWCKGPITPVRYYITPWFPALHEAPLKLRDRIAPKKKAKVIWLIVFYLVWTGLFFGLYANWKTLPDRRTPDYDMPIQRLACGSTLWYYKNECGLNGDECQPFTGSMAFRCPPRCKEQQLLNPRAVGVEEVNYQPLVVGGPIYRGDSFICQAAIHAGVIPNAHGGCGVLNRVANHTGFDAVEGNGITSVAFNSSFPLSFEFQEGTGSRCNGKDQQWNILTVSVIFTVLMALLTTSPAVFFFSVFIGMFAQAGLVSDPPAFGVLTTPETFSVVVGRLLPALFVAAVLYFTCVRRTLEDCEATIDKAIFWVGACWFGTLNNHTFDQWIPISRLTGHDLEAQPGAKAALIIIIILLVAIAIGQVYFLRQEGRLINYMKLYAIFVVAIAVCVPLPQLTLRIHHYILALLLLPGTSQQTRAALIYQGLLMGLFINGIARWDFASILETAETLREDGALNSALPVIKDPVINLNNTLQTIAFNITIPDAMEGLEGISILINDVERFRTGFNFTRKDSPFLSYVHARKTKDALPEYFRFGYLHEGSALDYTQAGTWHVDGNWTEMAEGPS